MKNLKSLGVLVGGVIAISAIYSATVSNRSFSTRIEVEDSEGVRQIVSGDQGKFALNQDGLTITASWRGDYTISDNGDDIAALDRKIEITREDRGTKMRVVFEKDGDGVKRSYFLNGEKQADAEAIRKAGNELLSEFLGASGVKAEERVAILLRRGGAEAVINEISAMHGDHARQRYAAELVEQTDLTSEELRALLDALKTMESDHDLREALGAILDNETIAAQDAPMIVKAAARIENDYDLRRLIETIAEKPMGEDAVSLAVSLLDNIETSHDFRRAAEALIEQESLTSENAARLITLAGNRIDNSYDLRLLLGEMTAYLETGGAAAAAWTGALSAIDSDHEIRLTLADAADEDDIPDDVLLLLIEACEKIDADYDRSLALEYFAARAKSAPDLLAAYEKAARAIDSDTDRRRALQAAGLEE